MLAHDFRLLSDSSAHSAAFYSLYAVSGTVKANDEDLLAGTLSSFDCTQSHFVVLSENSFDIRVSLQHVFCYSQALAAVKFSSLFSNNGQLAVSNFVEAFAAFTGSTCTGDTLQLSNLNLFAQLLNDVISSHFAALYVIGSNQASNIALVSAAVEADNRDFSLVGSLYRSRNCIGVNRVNQQNADVLLQQVSNIISLLCRIVLSVNNLYGYAQFLSLSFYAFSQGNEERIVLSGYGEANGDFLIVAFCSIFFVAAAAADNHHSHCYNAG